MSDFQRTRLCDNIQELGKSTIPAGASSPNGSYPFYCSGPYPKKIDKPNGVGPTIILGTGGVASVHYATNSFAYSTDTWAIRSKDTSPILTYYLFRLLQLQLPHIDYQGFEGSGLKHLRKEYVRNLDVFAPSGDVQRRIVEVLSTIDDAIDQTEALIAKTQSIKAGLMHDLFTRGVTSDGQLRPSREEAPKLYKETSIGWIPREWEYSNAGSEFDITSGITLGPHRRPKRNPYPYLRVANIYAERLDLQDIAFLEAGADVSGKSLAVGDLLVVEGHANPNEIGRCALATPEVEGFTFQNHLFRLRARRVIPALAERWLNHHVVRSYWLRTCSTSSGLNTINQTQLRAVPVIVPLSDEQRMLCEISGQVSDQIDSCREANNKLRQLKNGLMCDLLTGRVRVPIDEREKVQA